MSTPIERIAGYACEVNEDQWRELVKVADEVGLRVGENARKDGVTHKWTRAGLDSGNDVLALWEFARNFDLIPYPDFLAKLKGEEKWEPKNGEEVEASEEGNVWRTAEFVAMSRGRYVVWLEGTHIQVWSHVRPIRPTITRAEAEQKLKELGVIARIVD